MAEFSQLELFSEVFHAYSADKSGVLDNKTLYQTVAERMGLDPERFQDRRPVGVAGEIHDVNARRIRWQQQTLKHNGILEKVEGERGVWRLTRKSGEELNKLNAGVTLVGYSTNLGICILGSCDSVFASIDSPITLMLTSPPYPLRTARKYGNVSEAEYVDWICRMLEPIVKNLVRGGSICLNVSNDIFMPGMPSRSLYRERLVIALSDRFGLHKMEEFIWRNPCKPPGPFQWASKERFQLNVEWEPIYWFTNDPHHVRADNRRVLQQHSEKHLELIRKGGEQRERSNSDGAYRILQGAYGNPTQGKIPKNVLTFPHNCASQQEYKRRARAMGLPAHGAPMPLKLAEFLIEYLTMPGDVVGDMCGGSNTTGLAAERLGRRWITAECMAEYVISSATRFEHEPGFKQFLIA
jgi:DNA modification methylase